MNDKEKDLINDQSSPVDSQTTDENVLANETQTVNENVPASDLDGTVGENAPIENAATETEKVKVKNAVEPSKDVLFGGYEVKNWEFSPRIYKILAGAAVFNLLALFVVAQTNMLATSACESPFVNNVCDVLDTVYVGKKLFDGSNEFGKEEFDPTKITSEDIVWVSEDGITPSIKYPEGYFQIANRDEIAAREALLAQAESGFGNSSTIPSYNPPAFKPTPNSKPPVTVRPRSRPPVYRPRSRNKTRNRKKAPKDKLIAKDQVLPDEGSTTGKTSGKLFSTEGDEGENTANNQDGNNNKPTDKDAIAKNTAKDSDPVKQIVDVNRLPLELLVIKILEKQEENELELKKPFAVKLKAKLNEDGTFDNSKPENTRYLVANGEPAIIDLAKSGIEALGDSKFLKYLTDLDVENIELTVVQNDNQFQAQIVSSQSSPQLAKSVASGLKNSINIVKYLKKKEINGGEKDPDKLQNEKDQLYLLQNTALSAQGNNFVLTINLKRSDAQEMIKRSLENEARKRKKNPEKYGKPNKPNGSANLVKTDDNKAK